LNSKNRGGFGHEGQNFDGDAEAAHRREDQEAGRERDFHVRFIRPDRTQMREPFLPMRKRRQEASLLPADQQGEREN